MGQKSRNRWELEYYDAIIQKQPENENILIVLSEQGYIGTIKKDNDIIMGTIGSLDKFSIGVYGETLYLGYSNEDKRVYIQYDFNTNGYRISNKSTSVEDLTLDPDGEYSLIQKEFKLALDEFFNQVLKIQSKTKKKVL